MDTLITKIKEAVESNTTADFIETVTDDSTSIRDAVPPKPIIEYR